MNEPYDYLAKLLIIGDSGVGKSCLLLRFVENFFQETFVSTIGVDFKVKVFQVKNGSRIKLHVWDTAGQERFRTITSSYYHGSHGMIIVYDVTNRRSFQHIKSWLTEIIKHSPENPDLLLVGNKTDLASQRVVSYEEGKKAAETLGIPFVETSCKSDCNVNKAFSILANKIYNKMDRANGGDGHNGVSSQRKKLRQSLSIVPARYLDGDRNWNWRCW